MKQFLFIVLSLGFIHLNATTYIGIGSGLTEQEAKQNALKDVSSQILVHIDSTITQKKNIKDGVYSKDTQEKSRQRTSADLSGYKLLEVNFKNAVYFVKLSYENIPSLDKFVQKLPKDIKKSTGKGFLQKTKLARSLKKKLGFSIDFEIFRKDKQWYVQHKNITQVLDSKDFSKLFTSVANDKLSITTNKPNNILYENDAFYFKVKAKSKGYVSILTVYEDGTVSTLVKNIPVGKAKLENIPDKDFEAIPEAGLLESGMDTFDMYVAVYSPKKLYIDSFVSAYSEVITDERYKNFDELIEFMDTKTYTTLKVVTKPR